MIFKGDDTFQQEVNGKFKNFLAVLGFELMASHLLDRHSTT
jgi:hypothetical protein